MTNQIEEDPETALITLDLAHVLWFQQRGRHIEDPEELHAAWRDEHIEATIQAREITAEIQRRGMRIDFFDQRLARFAPKKEVHAAEPAS